VGGVLLLQAFNSFSCYQHDVATFLSVTFTLLAVPLLPALISLPLKNPLRAVGACALFAPWLVLAYYTDCIRPYSGGGASMIYVAVFLWGTITSVIGALIAPLIAKGAGIEVS